MSAFEYEYLQGSVVKDLRCGGTFSNCILTGECFCERILTVIDIR